MTRTAAPRDRWPRRKGYDEIVDLIDDADAIRERGQRLITAARAGDADRVEKLLDQHASIAARDRTKATLWSRRRTATT